MFKFGQSTIFHILPNFNISIKIPAFEKCPKWFSFGKKTFRINGFKLGIKPEVSINYRLLAIKNQSWPLHLKMVARHENVRNLLIKFGKDPCRKLFSDL